MLVDEQKLRGKVQRGDLYCNPIWGQQSYHKVTTTLLNKCRERVCVCECERVASPTSFSPAVGCYQNTTSSRPFDAVVGYARLLVNLYAHICTCCYGVKITPYRRPVLYTAILYYITAAKGVFSLHSFVFCEEYGD